MSELQQKLNQLAGLAATFAREIEQDQTMSRNEKYFILQDIIVAMKPFAKAYADQEKGYKSFGLNHVKIGETEIIDGISYTVKQNKSTEILDAEKLEVEYQRVLSEIGAVYKRSDFVIVKEGATTVKIQQALVNNLI